MNVLKVSFLLIIPLLMISCGGVKNQVQQEYILKAVYDTITKECIIDTLIVIEHKETSLTRQERLLIRDSMKHEQRIYKFKTKRISDSLNYELKNARIEIKELREINKSIRDSLGADLKRLKIENNTLKIENKKIIQEQKIEYKKERKNVKWYVWVLLIAFIISLILLILVLLFK